MEFTICKKCGRQHQGVSGDYPQECPITLHQVPKNGGGSGGYGIPIEVVNRFTINQILIAKGGIMGDHDQIFGLGNDNKMYIWLSWAEEPRWELYVTKE